MKQWQFFRWERNYPFTIGIRWHRFYTKDKCAIDLLLSTRYLRIVIPSNLK